VRRIRIRLGAHPAKVGGLGAAPFEQRSSAMMSTRFGVACMLARGQVRLADTQEPGGADIRHLAEMTEIEVDPDSDSTVGLEIVTDRGTFGSPSLTEFADYRLAADEIRKLAEPIIAERLGEPAAVRLLDMLDHLEQVESVPELIAATLAAKKAPSAASRMPRKSAD
jgi:hypothetical protein